MKNGLFKLSIIGNVGGDATLGTLPSGTPVADFSVAVNETFKDRNQQEQSRTTWVKCSIYGKRAEALAPYITKGIAVFVSGKPGVGKPWQPKGESEYVADMTLAVGNSKDDFIFLGGGRAGEETPVIEDDEQLFTTEN